MRPIEHSYETSTCHYDNDEVLDTLFQLPEEFLLWWANPEIEVANKLLGEQIMNAIDGLPDVFRDVIVLVNIECLSYDDAADVLGIPPGTVRSRMKRGRTMLQKVLWHEAQDYGIISRDVAINDGVN